MRYYVSVRGRRGEREEIGGEVERNRERKGRGRGRGICTLSKLPQVILMVGES